MATSVRLPAGFRTSGSTCGIKASGNPDLALFVSDTSAVAAGVFTQNRVCGAPVIVSRSRVPRNNARAIVINAGNANACTGQSGVDDARRMTAAVAAELGCDEDQVLVCSTGIIGVPLPMQKILAGIPAGVTALTSDAPLAAATAIMTTDTFAKLTSVNITLTDGNKVVMTGICKGAAMIAPNMATMLAVVMTDARLSEQQAQNLLTRAVGRSFNCISVDGHTSTSDTVLLLANGQATAVEPTESDLQQLEGALTEVCVKLATDIIRDAEGADHFIAIDVQGLSRREQAFRMAKEIADSPLVKTAITGADPNWGRIVSAAGYAGVDFDTNFVSLRINDTVVYDSGVPTQFNAAALSEQMKNDRDVHIVLSVSGGPESGTESARYWTSDLTTEYVRLNSEYTT